MSVERTGPLSGDTGLTVCVDVGSTWTKAALVDTEAGSMVARVQHRTTLPGTTSGAAPHSDVLEGVDRCVALLCARHPAARGAEVLACSSAGGGLRIGVVGNEALVTAEAGRRVALSSGGHVVAVVAGAAFPGPPDLASLEAAEPDVVLLVGGTDGGDPEVLLRCARALADRARSDRAPGDRPWPVVVAGNRDAAAEVSDLLTAAGTPCTVTANVLPQIGVLDPGPARRAVREVFLSHVIGGSELSTGPRFAELVRGATPDVVLTAVELLAEHPSRVATPTPDGWVPHDRPGVVVVDVGGATTDVYSVVPLADGEGGPGPGRRLSREVVAVVPANRTVEGDLGVRWSATGTVTSALAVGGLLPADADAVREGVAGLLDDPARVPATPAERDLDARLAGWAAGEALRRHARAVTDLRTIGVVVGSGGALRHADDPAAVLAGVLRTDPSWLLPRDARVTVDADYVLAAAGLLAENHRAAALGLLERFC